MVPGTERNRPTTRLECHMPRSFFAHECDEWRRVWKTSSYFRRDLTRRFENFIATGITTVTMAMAGDYDLLRRALQEAYAATHQPDPHALVVFTVIPVGFFFER